LILMFPQERVSQANFEKIELGMSQAAVQRILGPPEYQTIELGMVQGPKTYSIDFHARPEELRLRGHRDYKRQQWSSPEITIIVIWDAGGSVVCRYTGEGQRRLNPLELVWYWISRLF
jgi:hypothetical protein